MGISMLQVWNVFTGMNAPHRQMILLVIDFITSIIMGAPQQDTLAQIMQAQCTS
jgi:hypothetical protein